MFPTSNRLCLSFCVAGWTDGELDAILKEVEAIAKTANCSGGGTGSDKGNDGGANRGWSGFIKINSEKFFLSEAADSRNI